MKKRLLFALMAMCVAVSGFALEKGQFVYTPQGRFQITGDNVASSTFADFTGWTATSEAKAVDAKFIVKTDGLAAGMNSVSCVDAPSADNAGEGMYFKFVPTSSDAAYVVSFKMKGAALDHVRNRKPGDGYNDYRRDENLVVVAGCQDGEYIYPLEWSEDGSVVIANTAEELSEEWQTFNYAIQGDGSVRTWFISFTTLATTIEIADLQIAPAMQFADLRQRDVMLNKLNAYKNCYEWSEDVWKQYDGYSEVIESLKAIGDESGQAELDELLETAKEVLVEFQTGNMDDYLAGGTKNYNYLGLGEDKMQKVSTMGIWNCLPSGRGHWSVGAYADMGHYAGNTSWCWSDTEAPMGVTTKMQLAQGSYVFGIESKAALREHPTSSSWTINEGWNPAYGIAYVVKIVDGVATDTIATEVKGLESAVFTPFVVTAKVEEAGTYEIGMKAYCKDLYKTLTNGSVVEVKDASIWAKTNLKYKRLEYAYEEDVKEQITTGRDNLTKAAEYLADESYLWGKDALKACADSIETKIAAFEAMSEDEIIATFDKDIYSKSTSDSAGLYVFKVYQEATKWIIAANKEFVAENDTLSSMQSTIANAETTLSLRIYDTATGKDALKAAIAKAKEVQAQMKASQYSVENAAIIVAANAELNEAVTLFTTTIPAENLVTIVDIDFEKPAELDLETFQYYIIPGEKGSMLLTSFSEQAASDQVEYEKGFWSNGEQLWKGYLRVGNGTGTVSFDPTIDGSMGTNILKVACDFYIQGLSGKQLGFFLKDASDENIFGLYHNFYNAAGTTTNTCDVDLTKIWSQSGGSYADASPADAVDSVTANPLQKTHFEVIMDYGKGTQYCTVSSPNGSTTSGEVAIESIPAKFVLQCDYNVAARRGWFDNLLIQRITAGAYDPSAINTLNVEHGTLNGAIYNLAGQKVGKDYKGLVIKNGRKQIQK